MPPYVDVEWSHDDTPTEAKLDGHYSNLAYLRDEIPYRQIACSGWSFGVQAFFSGNDATWEWRVRLAPGSAATTARAFNSTEYALDNMTAIDISGYADNSVHSLDLWVEVRESGGSWQYADHVGRIYFLKTPEIDRLSIAGQAKGIPQKAWTGSYSSYLVVNFHDLQVAGYRNTGDASWVAVDFVGASPGPAEIISDTDMNALLDDADILRHTANARAIGSQPIFSSGTLVTQTTTDEIEYRIALRVDGVVGYSHTFDRDDGWVICTIKNLDVSTLPDWYACKATVVCQYRGAGDWTDAGDGPLAEPIFWNTPDSRYATLRGTFKINAGTSPGMVTWSTYRSCWTLGYGIFITRETID